MLTIEKIMALNERIKLRGILEDTEIGENKFYTLVRRAKMAKEAGGSSQPLSEWEQTELQRALQKLIDDIRKILE